MFKLWLKRLVVAVGCSGVVAYVAGGLIVWSWPLVGCA